MTSKDDSSMSSNDPTSPQQRIAEAFDPQLLESAGHRLVDLLGEHFRLVESSSKRVLNWTDPPTNVETAASFLRPDFRSNLTERFAELVQEMLSRGHNLHDPRYIGHQVPAPVPIAGLFDAVGAVTNQVMAIYEMGPWASSIEHAMVCELGQQVGWNEDQFSGLITHGGSLANLTALTTARNVSLGDAWEVGVARNGPPPVMLVHADAHYGVARSAGILGIGTNNIVSVGLDERRRMDPNQLDENLCDLRQKGHPIVAVVACACATPIGAFDPLNDISDVCQRHEVWLHVDAAHGGSACLSKRYKHLVDGLERVDSLIWDAHKMMFVPALCAFVFYRNKEHRFETFRQNAPYLFDPSAPGMSDYDSGLRTVECTKRAAAFGLWGVWSMFGKQLFEDMVDITFDLGRLFYEKLAAASDFETLHEPECNIVMFRYRPTEIRALSTDQIGAIQLEIRRRLIQSGQFYIVQNKFDGYGALRVTIINPLTDASHLEELMDAIREIGKIVIDEAK